MTPLAIASFTATSAAGAGNAAFAHSLATSASGLAPNDLTPLPCFIGRVPGLEDDPLPPAWADWDCRATRLAWRALQADGFAAAVPRGRVGVVLGTSASTIAVTEQAYRDGRFAQPSPRLNTPHALAMFVQQALGVRGPCVTVSTACSSSAKAFAVGARWLQLGLCDAVVAGGVDALSNSLLYGFRSLGLLSEDACRPFDARRNGISIGEAAAFALLLPGAGALHLLGCGEASDAHHMSAPHPEGRGAEAALDAALAAAGLPAHAIDHVNLHGTASAQNDEVEAALVARRYAGTAASATKGLTGHTMGAAGALEAVACLLAIERGIVPGSAGTASADPAFGAAFGAQLQLQPLRRHVRTAASHSFGFGGSNAVLVFGGAA